MTRRVPFVIGPVIVALVVAACTTTPPVVTDEPSETTAAETTAEETVAEETAAEETVAPEQPTEGRLALVQDRGELICGINGSLPGFSVLDEASGEVTGFDADFCRALAAAVLGDPTAVQFRQVTTDGRGPALQTGEVDVLIRNTTWTVTRDATWGLFAPTTFYDGQGIMVRADVGAETLEDLAGATICVQSGTTTELNLTDQMRTLGVDYTPLVFAEIDPTYAAYEDEACDAVTSDRSQLLARRTAFANPEDHVLLDVVMSKEPLGPVAPLGDDQWFNVVKWTVYVTFEAEEQEITSDNVEEMRDTSENPVVRRLLGVQPEAGELAAGLGLEDDWVVNVILAVGNYAEIYDRNLGPNTPFDLDRGFNSLWTDGGLLYAPPYR